MLYVMRCFVLIFVEISALTAATPVPFDDLFASDAQDMGFSPSSNTLFDSLDSGTTFNSDDIFSSSALSDPNDSLLSFGTTPGDMTGAAGGLDTTNPSEFSSSILDPTDYSDENNDLFGQLSQGEASGDCIPEVEARSNGKIRQRRSCLEYKEAKNKQTCIKGRSQPCCCSNTSLRVDGVFYSGCKPSTHTPFFSRYILPPSWNKCIHA